MRTLLVFRSEDTLRDKLLRKLHSVTGPQHQTSATCNAKFSTIARQVAEKIALCNRAFNKSLQICRKLISKGQLFELFWKLLKRFLQYGFYITEECAPSFTFDPVIIPVCASRRLQIYIATCSLRGAISITWWTLRKVTSRQRSSALLLWWV